MKVTELTVNVDDLATISSEQLTVRSVGLHVSSIIQHIVTASGLAELNDFTEADLDHFAVIGRLWEEMLARTLFQPPRYQRPGEIEVEGVYGSPDAVDTVDPAVCEFKVTWKSSNRAIESFFKYMLQVKAYCYMLGLTQCRLYVLFVCGNYRPPLPQVRGWLFEFSQHELKDNWRMLLANAKEM